jgi:cob(I)alamin adenosyltransferase
MKIYTKAGDDGSTGLIGGSRVPKSDPRIDCIGAIDELNAVIGWVAVESSKLAPKLLPIQNELFVIGSQLAASGPHPAHLPSLESSSIDRLEMEIDAATEKLEPLRNFILPGGGDSAARIHIARAVCRQTLLTYLNRLSDWLFVQARYANHLGKIKDIPWENPA